MQAIWKRSLICVGVLLLLLSVMIIIPTNKSHAASQAEIKNELVHVIYNGEGGYLSCDFDGYTTTSGRHEGIDFVHYEGAPVYALISGTVIRASNASNLSTIAIYDAENDKTVIYLHSNVEVSTGDRVTKGERIANEGRRGAGSQPHTHVEVRDGQQGYASTSVGDPVLNNDNPYPYWESVLFSAPTDSDSPSFHRVWIEPHNHTELMLKANVTDSSGLSEVRAYYRRTDKAEWHSEVMTNRNDGEFWQYINAVDGYGDYDIHIYATDTNGHTTGPHIVHTGFDNTAPEVEELDIIDIDDTGFTLTGKYKDNECSLEDMRVAVWTANNGQDDLIWEQADGVNGNRFYVKVNYSDHNNERGGYNLHVYVKNKALLEGMSGFAYEPIYQAKQTIEKDGHIYAIYDNSLSWNSARAKAAELGGHLVTINSAEEQAVVNDLINNAPKSCFKKGYWLGGYKDGGWKWVTGESVSYEHWGATQPDNAHNNEDRLMAFNSTDGYENGQWNDAWDGDYASMGFIVEFEGMTETKSVVYNGKKYTRYDMGLPWNEAQKFCEAQGGTLAMVGDAQTQEKVQTLINGGRKYYFLGLTNLKDNAWKWMNGTAVGYTNWDESEPTNTNNIEHYVIMTYAGKWRDVAVHLEDMTQMGFICETPYAANVESVTLNQTSAQLKVGEKTTLKATVLPDDATNKNVSWSSNKTSVATVKDGVVTAVGAGEATIIVTTEDGKKTASCKVTVTNPTTIVEVESVSLNISKTTLSVGGETTLTATVKPDNATNPSVQWTSNNTAIATVNGEGKVHALSPGEATISAQTGNGKVASCVVTVKKEAAADALKVTGSCSPSQVTPGGIVTVTVNLENYDISPEDIGTMQVNIPKTTNELSYVEDSEEVLVAKDGEVHTANEIIFVYFSLDAGENLMPKDTNGLFSFQMKVNENITEDMDLELPMAITIGNKANDTIMNSDEQTITIPVRQKVLIKGDLDGKNGVNIIDARIAKGIALKEIAPTEEQLITGDVDGKNGVNIIDARMIKMSVLDGLILK